MEDSRINRINRKTEEKRINRITGGDSYKNNRIYMEDNRINKINRKSLKNGYAG